MWKRLEHQNIVPFLGITLTPLQLVSEWMPGGTLAEYIKKNPGTDRLVLVGALLTVLMIISCLFHHQLSDVADGLSHLHSRNVIHGDLKGVCNYSKSRLTVVLTPGQQSILVDSSGRARITDFGLATVTKRVGSVLSVLEEYQQIARWTAPEILNDQGSYSKEADIFSFAMVTIAVRHASPTAHGLYLTVTNQPRHSPALSRSIISPMQQLWWP